MTIDRRGFLRASSLAGAGWLGLGLRAEGQFKEVLPKHVTAEALRSVIKGLDYLSTTQSDDGA
jgi:hypothetical protein